MVWAQLGATIASSVFGNKAAKKARKAQEAAAQQAEQALVESTGAALQQVQPYQQAGQSAIKAMLGMQGLPGGTPFDITQDPSYQFRLNQSMGALEKSAAARGGLLSGNFGNQALKLAGDYASTEYSNIYNRLNNIVNFGLQGAIQAANIHSQYGANKANILTGKGAAQASGYVAQGNVLSSMAQELGAIDWGSIGKGGMSTGSVAGTTKDPSKLIGIAKNTNPISVY